MGSPGSPEVGKRGGQIIKNAPGGVLFRQDPYVQFLQATEKAGAVRTLESLARIELGAQGGALLERVTTTRISKSGVATLLR